MSPLSACLHHLAHQPDVHTSSKSTRVTLVHFTRSLAAAARQTQSTVSGSDNVFHNHVFWHNCCCNTVFVNSLKYIMYSFCY